MQEEKETTKTETTENVTKETVNPRPIPETNRTTTEKTERKVETVPKDD